MHKLAELGAWGVSLHDDDLIPLGSSQAEKDKITNPKALWYGAAVRIT